jgi:O-antigen biosynthesis protein WbqP
LHCTMCRRKFDVMGDQFKRVADMAVAFVALISIMPIAVLVALAVCLTSRGSALYWSNRVGQHGKVFRMPKFRTMRTGTPALATHLMPDARTVLTPIGGILRRTSLDEIPQLWSVLIGDMSFVGPRPALFNQDDLIDLRSQFGVDTLRPGITGWAQINGRDELSIATKVEFDREYFNRRSMMFDLQIMMRTVGKLLGDDTVTH